MKTTHNKKLYFIFALLLLSVIQNVNAQNFNEWFKQKKTQQKYLLQQIAGLQVYIEYARKGYDIVRDGTQLLGDIRHGDFNLHKTYFSSLKAVNPAIQQSDQVKAIRKMHQDIKKGQGAVIKLLSTSKMFNVAEMIAITNAYSRLLREADKAIEELDLLTQSGKLELSDDERLKRIDGLHEKMKRKYGFQNQMHKNIQALHESRTRQMKDAEVLKKLYGL